MNFLASVFTGVALTAGSFFGGFFHSGPGTSTPPFGGRPPIASSTWPNGGDRPVASSTWGGPRWNEASSTVTTAVITCVGSAVSTREQTLDSAEATLTGALNSAYLDRASALASAYGLTTGDAVHMAVQAAWQSFASSTRSAQKSWRTARMAAWQTFMTAARTCKAPPSVLDTNDSSLETQGD